MSEIKQIKARADNDQNSQDEQIEDVLRKEIAELRLEIEKNNKNSENINNLINKLISYRIELRSSQKYEESDVVRDILTDSNIEIEDRYILNLNINQIYSLLFWDFFISLGIYHVSIINCVYPFFYLLFQREN